MGHNMELTEEMKELILEEIEKQQRQAQHEHWLFVKAHPDPTSAT